MKKMMKAILIKLKDKKGATAVEYGIMVALIAAVIITIVGSVGGRIENAFNKVDSSLSSAGVGT